MHNLFADRQVGEQGPGRRITSTIIVWEHGALGAQSLIRAQSVPADHHMRQDDQNDSNHLSAVLQLSSVSFICMIL